MLRVVAACMLTVACGGHKDPKEELKKESLIMATQDAGNARLVAGDDVFVRSVGLGRVTGFATKGADGRPTEIHSPQEARDFYVIQSEFETTYIPIDNDILRPLVSSVAATTMLETLRGPTPKLRPEDTANMVTPRSMEIIQHGTPEQAASFLRELYALPELDHRQGMALLRYETLVVDEIAHVLRLDREKIVAEMRERYPAFEHLRAANQAKQGRVEDVPNTVAVPLSPQKPPKPVRK
jgi:hypothetical protein